MNNGIVSMATLEKKTYMWNEVHRLPWMRTNHLNLSQSEVNPVFPGIVLTKPSTHVAGQSAARRQCHDAVDRM